MRESIERLGGLDGLAITAGIAGYATIEDTDEARWEHILNVNLVAAGLLTRHALAGARRVAGRPRSSSRHRPRDDAATPTSPPTRRRRPG